MKLIATIVLIVLANSTFGQYAMYRFDSLAAPTMLLGANVYHHLLLPQELDTTASLQSYPLIVLFDQQNQFTTKHNFNSIDIFTMHAQMPQCVVVGIPLENNRWELTSQDTIYPDAQRPGIELLYAYLMEELIPTVQKKYHAHGPLIVIGHSRTAYFTMYLQEKSGALFQALGSFSAFFENQIQANTVVDAVLNRPSQDQPVHYVAAGTSREESTYFKAMQELKMLVNIDSSQYVPFKFREGYMENHMSCFNMSLPWMLNDYFGTYSQLLESWLFDKCDIFTGEEAITEFKRDFQLLKNTYRKEITPNPVHIYSIASHYYNKGDLITCNLFLKYGRTYYPNETDMQPWE